MATASSIDDFQRWKVDILRKFCRDRGLACRLGAGIKRKDVYSLPGNGDLYHIYHYIVYYNKIKEDSIVAENFRLFRHSRNYFRRKCNVNHH